MEGCGTCSVCCTAYSQAWPGTDARDTVSAAAAVVQDGISHRVAGMHCADTISMPAGARYREPAVVVWCPVAKGQQLLVKVPPPAHLVKEAPTDRH